MKCFAVILLLAVQGYAQTQTKVPLNSGTKSTKTQLSAMKNSTLDKHGDLWTGAPGSPPTTLNPQVLASFPAPIQAAWNTYRANPLFNFPANFDHPHDLQQALQQLSRLNASSITALATLASAPVRLLQTMDLNIFALFNKAAFRTTVMSFSTLQKGALCYRIAKDKCIGENTASMLDDSLQCLSYAATQKLRVSKRRCKAMMKSKKRNGPPSGWTLVEWRNAIEIPEGWQPDDFMACPTAILLLNTTIQRFAEVADQLDEGQIKGLVKAIEQKLGGNLRTIAGRLLMQLAPLLTKMRGSELEKFGSAFQNAPEELARQNFSTPEKGAKIVKQLIGAWGNISTWNKTQIMMAGKLFVTMRHKVRTAVISKLLPNIKHLGKEPLDPRDAQAVMDRILNDSCCNMPHKWNRTMLQEAKHLLAGMSPQFISRINVSELAPVLGKLARIQFPKRILRKLWPVIRSNLPRPIHLLNCTQLRDLGRFLEGTDVTDLKRMDVHQMMCLVKKMRKSDDIKFSKSQIQAFIEQFERLLPGGIKAHLKKFKFFMRYLPTQYLRDPNSNVSFNGDEELDSDCDGDRCKASWERVKKTLGSVDGPNFTLCRLERLGNVIKGMEPEDIAKLPFGDQTQGLLAKLGDMSRRGELPDALEQAIAMKVKALLNTTRTNMTGRVDREILDRVAPFLKFYHIDELKEFGHKHCGDILDMIADSNMKRVPRKQLKAIVKYGYWCANKTSTGTFNAEEVSKIGGAICGIEPADLKRFDNDALFDKLPTLACKCNLPATLRRTILNEALDRAKKMNKTLPKFDYEDLLKLSCFVMDMTQTELSAIPADVKEDAMLKIFEAVDKMKDMQKERKAAGVQDDKTTSDDKAEKDGIKKAAADFLNSIGATSGAGAGGAAGRRRRQTTGVSCTNMKAMGSGVVGMTAAQITAMADADFLSCADFLGNETSWDANQIAALVAVAQRPTTFGTPNVWTQNDMQDAGFIGQGLSASDISGMTFSSMDGISAFGDYEGWSAAQLSAGYAKWLADYKGNTASAVNSTELIALGHFTCGATQVHIQAINSSEYQLAATDIGQLTSCSGSLSDWATHAVASFGSVSMWTASDVSSVGVVIGGLTAADLQTFSQSHVTSISTAIIPSLPTTTLSSMTTTQLGYMSTGQAQAVTTTQLSAMSTAQQNVVSSLGGTVYSSGVTTLVSSNVLLLSLVATLLHLLK